MNVMEATVARLEDAYAAGHRIVHSFSGGKDSVAMVECAIIAARNMGTLPIEAVMRDEELGWPDHYEYAERFANRPEVAFTWLVAGEPHGWVYDRAQPFWWAFDDRLPSSSWLRQPPTWATRIEPITIDVINSVERFPPPEGRDLIVTVGLRAEESRIRTLGVHSMGGWIAKEPKRGVRKAWPIYDWREGDVWRAIAENGWDYPRAYDRLARVGIARSQLRMGAFLNSWAARSLPTARKAYPAFFEQLFVRFPGLRTGIADWKRCINPRHLEGESWERTYWRENVQHAPGWIRERAEAVASLAVRRHASHGGGSPIPDGTAACPDCGPGRGSWRLLAKAMYLGDPWSETAASGLPYVEPERFRPELAGTVRGRWGGHPG